MTDTRNSTDTSDITNTKESSDTRSDTDNSSLTIESTSFSSDDCKLYHASPIKCQSLPNCAYRTHKNSLGQCYNASKSKDLEKTRKRARENLVTRPKFERDAGNRFLRANRYRQRHRGEVAKKIQSTFRRYKAKATGISITITRQNGTTLVPFNCYASTPIISLLEFIKVQTGDNLSSIKLYLDLDPRIPLAKELRHQILDFMSGISATDRDKPVSVISDDTNINLIMITGKSDHDKLDRFLNDLPDGAGAGVAWLYTDILTLLDLDGDDDNSTVINSDDDDGDDREELLLTQLPGSIGNLTNLTYLYLDNNALTQLPDSIGNLSNLEKLLIDDNMLSQLPDTISHLSNLKYLRLKNNHLTYLPDTIDNLNNLKELDLTQNNLTLLPDSIGNLTNLIYLYLYLNDLTQLPDSIGRLSNLKQLDLRKNNLTQLPDTIGNLTNLELLNLDNNSLTQLPDSIGNLSNLKELHLKDNDLTDLPDTIDNLTNLEEITFPHSNFNEHLEDLEEDEDEESMDMTDPI